MDFCRTFRRQRVPSTTAVVLALLLAPGLCTVWLRPASAQDVVPRVALPYGLSVQGAVSVSPGPTAATEYLVLDDVTVVNPNREMPQSYAVDDWALVDGDTIYHPTARKGLGAIDLSSPGILWPLEGFRQSITFVVPRTMRRASLQFTPLWYDERGARVQFCCA